MFTKEESILIEKEFNIYKSIIIKAIDECRNAAIIEDEDVIIDDMIVFAMLEAALEISKSESPANSLKEKIDQVIDVKSRIELQG
jgi:hypothetical protein